MLSFVIVVSVVIVAVAVVTVIHNKAAANGQSELAACQLWSVSIRLLLLLYRFSLMAMLAVVVVATVVVNTRQHHSLCIACQNGIKPYQP